MVFIIDVFSLKEKKNSRALFRRKGATISFTPLTLQTLTEVLCIYIAATTYSIIRPVAFTEVLCIATTTYSIIQSVA